MAKKEKTEMDDGGGDDILDDRREGERARATTRVGRSWWGVRTR